MDEKEFDEDGALASNPYNYKFKSLSNILGPLDKLLILEDLKNPKPDPERDRFLAECRELKRKAEEKRLKRGEEMKYNGRKLSDKDTKEILEELKNPQLTPQQREMFRKATEVYQKHKEYELQNLTDEEVESRANLPEDQWIELPEGVKITDYYRHLLKNKDKDDEKDNNTD